MKKNYYLLILFASVTFSCNNQTQTSDSKSVTEAVTMTLSDSSAIEAIETTASSDFVSKPLTNSNTTEQVTMSSEQLLDVYKKLDKTPQLFTIAANKDTTLICSEGTVIKINTKSFVSENTGKEILGNIEIAIKEYYKLSDILLARLSTTSNDNLLETGGMIHITAISNNENCILKQGKDILIEFPRKVEKEGMQLFTGAWKNEYEIDWTLEGNSIDLNKVYPIVEEMPRFPGGDAKINSYIAKTLEYPKTARALGIEGTVVIRFIVDREGNVTNARVLKGIFKECDEAALDVVKKMPKFNAGKRRGIAVNVELNLPIKFMLNEGVIKHIVSKEPFEKRYNDSTIQNLSASTINSYLFATSKLDWINCDRLWKISTESRIDYNVDLNGGDQVTLSLVFHRYKSVLNRFSEKSNFLFRDVPINEKITLVAIKKIDNKLFLAMKETRTSVQIENNLVFQPVTMDRLKTEMRKLDKFN